MAVKYYTIIINQQRGIKQGRVGGGGGNFGSAIEESARTVLCTAEHVIIQCEIARVW